MHQTVTDPDTEFALVHSPPGAHDGYQVGELTGEVRCCVCARTARRVEDIAHATDCDQRGVGWDCWPPDA